MKLNNYYQLQRILDFRIEHKFNLDTLDTVFDKLLALVVEIGETSNEHRGFKFWSADKKPRTHVAKHPTMNYDDITWTNPLLEEFVDCWHFAISIGVSLDLYVEEVEPRKFKDITKATLYTVSRVCGIAEAYEMEYNKHQLHRRYQVMLEYLLGLGLSYGLTVDEIEAAYIEKNQINHKRQLAGY